MSPASSTPPSPDETGIDIYMGIGGAPEGVLAAAALRCIGGQMQGRLVINSDEQRERADRMGIADFDHKYDVSEMARGDVLFAATGVTDGNLLPGRQVRQARGDHPHGGDALVIRHGALDQGRAPGPREILRRAVRRTQTRSGFGLDGPVPMFLPRRAHGTTS